MSAGIVISQVYGGGGNSGATYTHDFVELFNRGTTLIDLTGWSIQYASATGAGNFGSSSTQLTELSGVLGPGQYLLIQAAAGAGGTVALSPDIIDATPIALAAGAGKVALVNTTTPLACNGGSTACTSAALATIVDLVGYGNANFFEGASSAPTLSNTTAALRGAEGCFDTDNNGADFTAASPAPRNRLSPTHSCDSDAAPQVAATTPANGAGAVALDVNVTVTFSENVNVSGTWYSIDCSASGAHAATVSGGPRTFTLDPSADFAANESCTVTVLAANVTDQDADDPPDNMSANYVFSFQTAEAFTCGDAATFIHQVQGSGTATPMSSAIVSIEGVVVGDFQQPGGFGGFYMQEEDADADADPLTSEGIFVFTTSFAVNSGDVVRVRGRATESSGLTRLTSVDALLVCSTGATVTPTAISLPVANVTDLERYEGMLVSFDQTLTATEVFNLGRFGEVSLSGAGRLYTPTAVAAPGAAAQAVLAQNNRSRIILDDGNSLQNIDPTRYPQGGLSASNTLRVGDTLSSLTGVMDFRFNFYRIQPVGPITWDHSNPRTASPGSVGGNLTVASFNVLNLFNGDGQGGGFPTSRGAETAFELQRQLAKIVSALTAIDADIVGLMEIENDAGANSALAELVAALNAVMGAGTYAHVDTGVIGTDAIKVALIYKPAAATPVGAFQTITSAVDPRFIDTLNRPSLAQTFEAVFTGQKLTVVVNHLKSKGSACAGDPDTGDGQGNCNNTRTTAAQALADWLATDPTGSGDPDFLIIGDLNAYTFEDPITTLTTSGYTNLVGQFGGLGAYTYVFQGESGYLDHALATSSLASQVTGVTDWHINPDEPTVLDYNTNFKSVNQITTFYDPGPYRSSDHDPVIVGLSLATSAGTFANVEGAPAWPGGIRTRVNVNGMSGEAKGRVMFEGAGRQYHSTRIDSIVASGSDATVFGAFGSVIFRLDIHDGGRDGEDTLRLRTSDGYDSGVLTDARGQLVVNTR
ncbi:MAG TPA: ExeM/NucH family extracellular endonuclease [Candidatus Limnocylindria bacterium]|nr:ExeM/NucH family extracellular endonuclease [Candidatus Limnocylindria bacterium]